MDTTKVFPVRSTIVVDEYVPSYIKQITSENALQCIGIGDDSSSSSSSSSSFTPTITTVPEVVPEVVAVSSELEVTVTTVPEVVPKVTVSELEVTVTTVPEVVPEKASPELEVTNTIVPEVVASAVVKPMDIMVNPIDVVNLTNIQTMHFSIDIPEIITHDKQLKEAGSVSLPPPTPIPMQRNRPKMQMHFF